MRRISSFCSLSTLLIINVWCKKSTSPPQAPPSSDKAITGFEFRATDNPGVLNADVAGIIRNDSILISLPASALVTALAPYIIYTGKTITPASGVQQNFSSPLTYTVTAADGSQKSYIVLISFKSVLYISDATGELVCLDANTGRVSWKYQSTTHLSCPTVGNGLVFATGWDGLYAVNAVDGTLAWKISLTELPNPYSLLLPYPVYPIPIFSNGILYGSFVDGTVRAINPKDGSVRWSFTTNYPFASGPTLYHSSIYVGSVDGYLYSIDSANGKLNWKFKGSGAPIVDNPLATNNLIYFGSQNSYIYAVQAQNGQMAWESSGDFYTASPSESNGLVYSQFGNVIFAFDAGTGTVDWVANHNTSEIYNSISSVYIANGRSFFGSFDGNVYADDAATGAPVWSYYLGGSFVASPVVANGRVFIGNDAGYTVALNANDGSNIWTTVINGIATSVCLVDSTRTVYHAPESGELN